MSETTCPVCDFKGTIEKKILGFKWTIECPNCNGKGLIITFRKKVKE